VPLVFDRVLFDERESDGWPAVRFEFRPFLLGGSSSSDDAFLLSSSESLESANDLVARDRRVGRPLVLGEVRVLGVLRRFDPMGTSLSERLRFKALLPLVDTCNSSSTFSSELSTSDSLSGDSSSSSSTSEWLKSASDALPLVRVARFGDSKASCVEEAVRVLRRMPFTSCVERRDSLVERLDVLLVSCCESGVNNRVALRVDRAGGADSSSSTCSSSADHDAFDEIAASFVRPVVRVARRAPFCLVLILILRDFL
jgi:hypothetical protein